MTDGEVPLARSLSDEPGFSPSAGSFAAGVSPPAPSRSSCTLSFTNKYRAGSFKECFPLIVIPPMSIVLPIGTRSVVDRR